MAHSTNWRKRALTRSDRDALDRFASSRLSLCEVLEACADRLPELPTPDQLDRIGSAMAEIANTVLPAISASFATLPPGASPPRAALAELTLMHSLDTIHGEDLMQALWQVVRDRDAHDAATIGYMLRCYFDGCRRAIAYERLLIAMIGAAETDCSSPT